MTRKAIFFGPLALIGILFFITVGGLIVWAVWNWVMPPLFGLPEVSFWQALGLLVLTRVLFGGIGGRRWHSPPRGHRMRARVAERLIDRLAERMDDMSPEERERVRRAIQERFGAPAEDRQ
jgi:hypothetical protein